MKGNKAKSTIFDGYKQIYHEWESVESAMLGLVCSM